MAQYVPWYLKRSPPVFCWPCVPVYTGIWPGRKCVLILGAILFCIGVMILLGLLLTCIAVECGAVAGALLPLALILIIVGILIFHCGWAAHLLDYGGKVPADESTYTTRTKRSADVDDDDDSEDIPIVEKIEPQEPQEPIRQGFWQFEEKEAWQSVANPYPLQSVHYVAAPTTASTSKNYVQVPQFQVMTVPTSSSAESLKTSSKKSVKINKGNAESLISPTSDQQQHIQLVTMDQGTVMDNSQYIIQLPQGQLGGQFQVISNGNMAPMQLVNLSEGTAFVPITQTSSYNGQPSQPAILQASDGQQIQFVVSGDGTYNQSQNAITAMAIDPNTAEEAKPLDDAPCYVNPKQYARIIQRRGARAKLEMEGRISKQRRTYLHESRHKHALNRVRGNGGKFDSNLQDTTSSTSSSPTSSIEKSINGAYDSGKAEDSIDSEPSKKRFAPPPTLKPH